MKAEIEERLSHTPIKQPKPQKTTWQDIALGIYIGGMALFLTTAFLAAIAASIVAYKQEQIAIQFFHQLQQIR